ncbi:MAG: hypothetical protein JWR33_1943 [Naasia sp.]|jgi:hypothetical protein|uniref:PepSY domain-containing protein n=1 Tax=Naasia sp. TaxID=2546198 RepID=UPI00262ADFF6|nr:hypothetical protein [Naasia sp.]MCU1571202.1 hypothetical protein [Naasia sp.]
MQKKRLTLGLAGCILAGGLAVAGSGIANAAGAGDAGPAEHDTAISGSALETASKAALAATGQGRVTDSEVGDEESYYEVEVTLDDGSEVDVQLDQGFQLVEIN